MDTHLIQEIHLLLSVSIQRNEADQFAAENETRYTHEEVFANRPLTKRRAIPFIGAPLFS